MIYTQAQAADLPPLFHTLARSCWHPAYGRGRACGWMPIPQTGTAALFVTWDTLPTEDTIIELTDGVTTLRGTFVPVSGIVVLN